MIYTMLILLAIGAFIGMRKPRSESRFDEGRFRRKF